MERHGDSKEVSGHERDERAIARPSVVDRKASRSMAKLIGATNLASFTNAILGLGTERGQYLYVEGFVVSDDLPVAVEHAWLERIADGVIVDPTPIYHCREAERNYFAGHKWSAARATEAVAVHYRSLPLSWVRGRQLADHRDAQDEAERAIYSGTTLRDAVADL